VIRPVYWVYRELGLNHRVKPKKRLPTRHPQPLLQPSAANQVWSIDFMSDSLTDGCAFRTLTIIDDFNGEALHIEVDTSLPAARVIRVLEQVAGERGYPQVIRSDNGPEFLARALAAWTADRHLLWEFIEPGKPAQNAYIERFNRTYRAKMCWTPICSIRLRKFVPSPKTGWKSTTPCDRMQLWVALRRTLLRLKTQADFPLLSGPILGEVYQRPEQMKVPCIAPRRCRSSTAIQVGHRARASV